MDINIRRDHLVFGAIGVAAVLFLIWYFSADAQYRLALMKDLSLCRTAEDRARRKELAKYVLPGEKAEWTLVMRDEARQGRACQVH